MLCMHAPLADDVGRFWKSLNHENVHVIVFVDQNSHAYWPDDASADAAMTFGDDVHGPALQVTCQSVRQEDAWVERTLSCEVGGRVRTVSHFQFTAWSRGGLPMREDVVRCLTAVKQRYDEVKLARAGVGVLTLFPISVVKLKLADKRVLFSCMQAPWTELRRRCIASCPSFVLCHTLRRAMCCYAKLRPPTHVTLPRGWTCSR